MNMKVCHSVDLFFVFYFCFFLKNGPLPPREKIFMKIL